MMDLNNIQLTPTLLSDLYGFSLVEKTNDAHKSEAISLPAETTDEKTWKYLGNNKKNILIVVNHPGIVHLPDEDLNFLTTILAACKLDLGDVAIVNTNNLPEHSYKEYNDYFNSKIMLLFGVEPIGFGLPLDFPHFQVQNFSKYTLLYSPPLGEYDKLLKSKLWVSLKRIFGV